MLALHSVKTAWTLKLQIGAFYFLLVGLLVLLSLPGGNRSDIGGLSASIAAVLAFHGLVLLGAVGLIVVLCASIPSALARLLARLLGVASLTVAYGLSLLLAGISGSALVGTVVLLAIFGTPFVGCGIGAGALVGMLIGAGARSATRRP